MKRRTYAWLSMSLTAFIVCGLVAVKYSSQAQTNVAGSKFDEYGDLPTDDEAAHLDALAVALSENSSARGYIIGYAAPDMKRGYFLRRIYGIGTYFSAYRGIAANRIVVIDGGYKEKFTTELWLIPEGAAAPTPAPTLPRPELNLSKAYQFDIESPENEEAVNLYLDGLGEGVRFYAEALRESPDAKSLIVIRPGTYVTRRKILKLAQEAKKSLVEKYGIEAQRITIRPAPRNAARAAVAEMWIVPGGASWPKAGLK
ncbi:MAG: hypothetical protein JOZ52_06390 [Acidobacteria bacterium]|nr:hypothetical protein [Acidobacteriota bacterium]